MIIKNRKRQYWQEFKYWLVQLLLKDVTRVELIQVTLSKDGNSKNNVHKTTGYGITTVSCQDDFRTLKIFVK